jgi:hypothetical protein
MKITKQELTEKFKNFEKNIAWTGCSFMMLQYFTNEYGSRTKTVTNEDGKKEKKYALQKRVNVRITVGADYSKKINRLLEKQGENPDFEAKEPKNFFYKYGYNCPVVASKFNPNSEMILMMMEHNAAPKIVFSHEGVEITKEDAIKQNLFTDSYFEEKPTVGRGSIDKEFDFYVRTLKIENIECIKINGEEYIIED